MPCTAETQHTPERLKYALVAHLPHQVAQNALLSLRLGARCQRRLEPAIGLQQEEAVVTELGAPTSASGAEAGMRCKRLWPHEVNGAGATLKPTVCA